MNLQYYYWFFQAAIPPKICDDIIEYGKSQQEQIAVTGNHDPNNMNEKDIKFYKSSEEFFKSKENFF